MINQNTRINLALDPLTRARKPLMIVMAGGTGGHVFPALAVADLLVDSGCRVLWIGSRAGMEAELVPRHGHEMAWLAFGGLRGKGLMTRLLLPVRLLFALWQALVIMLRQRPAAVIGFGGYISFPGGLMAAMLGRRLLLHEQNAVAGMANRVLARAADRVLRVSRCAAARGVGRQPGARRDRAPGATGHALCRTAGGAAPLGGGRQPGCEGAQRDRATGAGAPAA